MFSLILSFEFSLKLIIFLSFSISFVYNYLCICVYSKKMPQIFDPRLALLSVAVCHHLDTFLLATEEKGCMPVFRYTYYDQNRHTLAQWQQVEPEPRRLSLMIFKRTLKKKRLIGKKEHFMMIVMIKIHKNNQFV